MPAVGSSRCSHLVGALFFGFDSRNLQTSQIIVPDTMAPTVNAAVVILKNRFHTSALKFRYCLVFSCCASLSYAKGSREERANATSPIIETAMRVFICCLDVDFIFYLSV